MNRRDAIVESRRLQKSNEPKACFWTVDQEHQVAWVPLKEKTEFSTKHDFMTRKLCVSHRPHRGLFASGTTSALDVSERGRYY